MGGGEEWAELCDVGKLLQFRTMHHAEIVEGAELNLSGLLRPPSRDVEHRKRECFFLRSRSLLFLLRATVGVQRSIQASNHV
jgi:hypothetical protein